MLKTYLTIGKIETLKDRSCKLTGYTPELKPEAMTELFSLQSKGEVAAIFQASESDNIAVEALGEPKEGKTPSQRLRNVLALVWLDQRPNMTKEAFYELEMEKILDHYKSKLPRK